MPMRTNYVIIGNGCAAVQAIETIRQHDQTSRVSVVSDSTDLPYNPMLLSYYLSEKVCEKQFFLKERSFYDSHQIDLIAGSGVKQLCAKERYLLLENGIRLEFDKALIASGASAFVPPISGVDAKNVFTLRSLEATRQLKHYLDTHRVKRALVIGASMIGIKVVEYFSNAGVECCLADGAQQLFPLASCDACAQMMQRLMEQAKVKLRFSAFVEGMETDASNRAVRVNFKDGKPPEEVDVVVLCIGVRPNISFVNPEEIACDRAILVDSHMRTSVPYIYAAGDCTQGYDQLHRAQRIIGLLNNARFQARTAALNMAGQYSIYAGSLPHNVTRFMGMIFTGIGDPAAQGEIFEAAHPQANQFARIVRQDGKIVFVNLLNYPELSGILKNRVLRDCGNRPNQDVSNLGFDEFTETVLRNTLRI